MFGLFKKELDKPTLFEMEQAFSYAEFTPDIAILERRQSNLLFVFDEMQEGHHEFGMIQEHAIPIGVAYTKDDFVLYKRKLNAASYAVALDEAPFRARKTTIRGKLFAIPKDQEDGSTRFVELDTVKENGVRFERRRITVIMPYQYIGRTRDGRPFRGQWEVSIRCYTYIGVQSYWSKLLEADDGFFLFDTVKTYTPNNPNLKEYYYFSKLEYEDK
jgi:hypothetical protein